MTIVRRIEGHGWGCVWAWCFWGCSIELNGGLLPDTSWSRMGVGRKWVVKLAAGLKESSPTREVGAE